MTRRRRLERKRKTTELSKQEVYKHARWTAEIEVIMEDLGLADIDSSDEEMGDIEDIESHDEYGEASMTPGTALSEVDQPRHEREPEASGKHPGYVSSAREYWEQQYAELGAQDNEPLNNNGKRPVPADGPAKARAAKRPNYWNNKKKQKKGTSTTAEEAKLMRMLRDGDPLTARAALGEVPMPGALQAKTKGQQWQQMLVTIASNPNKRDTNVDKRILDEATKSFGAGMCTEQDGKWLLAGMKTALYNHQLVGVRWMLGQEFSRDGPFGGILADEMGLGKTIEVLATMSANLPTPEDIKAGRRTTLIVAPASAIAQWMNEAGRHCSWAKKILHYRASKGVDKSIWLDTDIM